MLQQLVTSSLGCVLHCYDNLTRENIRFLQETILLFEYSEINFFHLGVSSGHQVHGSPHPLHHLAGDHPVGQVATAGHLKSVS